MPRKVTPLDFLTRLKSRMSGYNAQLLLNSALIETGLNIDHNSELSVDELKNLCLELIKKGGPAFHVGQTMYREHLHQ